MRKYLPIPLAFAALLLLPGSPQSSVAQERAPEARTTPVDGAKLRKELEVMRRILQRSIGGRATSSSSLAHAEVYLALAGGRATSSDAYYVHGDGALFVMTAGIPVAAGGDAPKASAEEPTLWDEVLADVEGRPNPRNKGKAKYTYDASKVKQLEANVLEVLGRYAANLSQVGDGEHVTVVLAGPSPEGGVAGLRVVGESDTVNYFYRNSQGHASTAGTVMTIRVTRRDCAERAEGRIDAEEFKARATVHRY